METATQTRPILDRTDACTVSWTAIIAGALIAFALSALLNLLNAGLGLVAFPETFRALGTITTAGYIWLVICGIIAMFIAGFATGKILRQYSTAACNGFLHGFLAWSLALLLSVIVAAHFAQATAQVANNTPAGTVSADNTLNQSDNTANAGANDNAAEQSQVAGGVTLGVFVIFLLGAISASLGGYLGARTRGLTKIEH